MPKKKTVVLLSTALVAVAGLGLAAATFSRNDDNVLRVANQKGQVKAMIDRKSVV